MGTVTYGEQKYELEALRGRMDKDLLGELDGSFSDQDFFESYLVAHNEKYGERFVVD